MTQSEKTTIAQLAYQIYMQLCGGNPSTTFIVGESEVHGYNGYCTLFADLLTKVTVS